MKHFILFVVILSSSIFLGGCLDRCSKDKLIEEKKEDSNKSIILEKNLKVDEKNIDNFNQKLIEDISEEDIK